MTPMQMDLAALMPEIALLVGASFLLLTRPDRRLAGLFVQIILFAAFLWTMPQWNGETRHFGGAYVVRPFEAALKCLALLATALAVILVDSDREIRKHHPETLGLLLLTAAGAMVLVSARHMAVAYLAFEMISVPSYALVGSLPGNARSTEGGLKYAVFGGAASAFLLFGMSLLYGFSGSLYFADIPWSLTHLSGTAFLFVFVGMMYKLAAAPFHYWCPDAFEGASASIAGFLSIVPKIGGFGLLLAVGEIWGAERMFETMLATAAVFSMTVGNLCALAQKNIRRLLAYSSVAHAGYLLVAASLPTVEARTAILFYLTAYVFMNLGAFYMSGLVTQEGRIDEFRGLSRRNPFAAFCMAVFLFSLTGLPPFGGFVGKLFILVAALKGRAFFLIAVLVINTVISLYYYARILREMYIEPADDGAPQMLGGVAGFTLIAMSAAIVLLGVGWGPIADLARLVSM